MSNALAGLSNAVQPSRSFRVLFAVAVTLLMVLSSAALVIGNSYNSHPNRLGAPQASASLLSGTLSPTQLQKAPFTTSPGTSALASHANATDYGPTALATPMMFTIGFQMRNSQMLEETLQAQSTPSSPLFHHWLTADQERTYFGPDPVAYQNTINYFTGLGFKVQTEGLLSVSFAGTTGQVNSAFHTQIDNVGSGQSGAIAPMNAQPLSLPSVIATAVTTVNGLDGTQVAHPSSSLDPYVSADVRAGSPSLTPPAAALPGTAGPQQNLTTIFNVSNHGFFWVYYYSHSHRAYRTFQVVTPGALNDLYNGSQLINQGINGDSTGTPITIALVMAGGINPSDMSGYAQLAWNNPNQILSRLFPQPVDGSFTDNGTVPWLDGASSEMALDIEFSSTMAPAAKIMPVYGPCLCTNVLDDDYALLLSQPRAPNIISNSWGGDEDRWPNLYGPNWVNALTMHNYFMLLDAKGSTVIASSGDGGGFDTGTGYLSGSFPATDPYVLSINGLRTAATDASNSPFPTTTKYGIVNISIGSQEQQPFFFGYPVHAGQATHMLSQTFWYEPFSNITLTGAPPQGAGGFDSSYWFNQTWMEHGYTVPDLGRSLGSGVAAEADYNQSIFFDGSMQFFWGGTSFACPTTAGELALVEDYLAHNGHSPYLGNGNGAVFDVANAYLNGNLTLKPFYDVATVPGVSQNGTSYWGNFGVIKGYEFPTAQKFPYDASGNTTYGNTLPGWDFPTGWGSLIVSNFAVDLNILESLPAQFATTNSAGTAYDAGAWDYMQLNHSYTIHVNASSALVLTNPHITVVFHGQDGTVTSVPEAWTSTAIPSVGMSFTLNTGTAPFSQPGFVVFELSNATSNFLAFAYDWISYPVPAGTLTVTVMSPASNSVLSGFPQFNPWPAGYFAPTMVDPNCCTTPNTFTVHVTLSGQPVYNALVTASVPSLSALAWAGSRIQAATQSNGNPHEQSPTILSSTYTNQLGDAVVYTWNLIQPTVYFVNATIGPNHGGTVYNITPGLNVRTTDNYGGKYSNFNTIDFVLQNLRQTVNPGTEQLWAPNSLNQTAYYNLLYAWQGEILPLSVNDWAGNPMNRAHVWLGNFDGGGENRFYSYKATGGVVGVTNVSGTANDTGSNGNTSIFIPDNQTDSNWFQYASGATAGFAFVAVNMPGQYNRTFSYTEPCAPSNLNNPKALITCQFNDTLQRNYTAIPTLILGNPVNVSTQTTAHIARDFFGSGANISWHVNFVLPNADPFVTGFGYYWLPGTEHVVSVRAYVDGLPAGDVSPASPPQWQNYTANGNLSGNYAPGIHNLRVVATDSLGHVFTRDHTFVVGGINVTNLGLKNTYTVLPYNVNWTYILPPGQVNNHTFSQSFEVRYVAPGCGGTVKCPQLVNLTIKIRPGVVDYNQSINITMLNTNHFYTGTQLPQGQYQVIIWLNANHSGSIAAQINTQLVFENVAGQINGPSDGALVPLGNVTISYSYSGEFIENATLFVFPAAGGAPVFQAGAFVPGINGLRGGASTWTAVTPGLYKVVLALGTPYGGYNATSMVNVSLLGGTAFLNQSNGGVLGGMSPAAVGTALAIIAAIVGLFLGLMLAPSLRQGPARAAGGAAKAAPKPWQEEPAASSKQVCPICHEEFETAFALHQHQKITHGIEE